MAQNTREIRIGKINYTNVWPIFHYFQDEMRGDVKWIHAVPAYLNRAMEQGEIDLAPISSFAYGQHTDDYILLPDLSVSAFGEVRSILLFHKVPVEQLDGKRIALTNTSATSVHLLKIILTKQFNIAPKYDVVRPHLDEMLAKADAALLIGDDAIRAKWDPPAGCEVTDVGKLWQEMTGEWMSFALWAVRKQTAERYPEQLNEVLQAFLRSKRRVLLDNTPVIKQAVQQIGGTESYWHTYFSGLSHHFDGPQQRGLNLYYQYAYELGFLKKEAKLQIWEGISHTAKNY